MKWNTSSAVFSDFIDLSVELAVCGHLFSVILASVDISIENVITSGSLPLERCVEGKVRLHYNLKEITVISTEF